jgi:putative OPT family oligopeptide transporter
MGQLLEEKQAAPAPTDARKELTVRGVILGVLITLIFTAANVFFGLKAGLTFATSIPAAVISMAVLRGFKDVTIQENNIVQTVASAAGTLSAIIFVLPGLVIIGWWTGFPYWASASICALGGVLGVMYSIPLRRALVTESDLPYPEGVACAEVLKVGGGGTAGVDATRAGLLALLGGSIVSAVFALIVATRVFASDLARYFRIGDRGGATGFDLLFSVALFGIGHLVGLWVGVAIGLGALIAWAWGVPHYSALNAGHGAAAALAQTTWSHQVRFVGAGTILIAAIWTLVTLVKPVYGGLRSALAASRARRSGQQALMPRTEQDIPIGIVGVVTLVCLAPIAILLANFDSGGALASKMTVLVIGGVVYIALMSFFVSSVCGYMAGLIGASNSPLSGIGILAVIGAALLMVAGVRPYLPTSAQPALVAYALFVTAVVFAVATIANNNLQDLKTGQLVDATPWKQQVALVFGVAAGAAIIPPILDLLNHAYGFAGAPGTPRTNPLPAPQAGLISALAQGVLQNNVDWSLIGVGMAIGIGMIVINAVLRRTTGGRVHLSPLAVGLGIYLPTQSTLMVVLGALAGWYFDRRAERRPDPAGVKQLGVLLASGLIVGEGLMGVLVAALVAFSGKDFPLSLVSDQFAATGAVVLSCVAFAATMFFMYRWVARLQR